MYAKLSSQQITNFYWLWLWSLQNITQIFNYLYRMRESWKRNLRHSDVNGRKRLDELSLTVAHHEIHPLLSRPPHLVVKALRVLCFWKLRTLLIQHHLLRRKRYYFDSFYFDSFWWGYIDPIRVSLRHLLYSLLDCCFILSSSTLLVLLA